MAIMNIEIKARCPEQGFIRTILKARNAEFRGTDHQIDTYFKMHSGRLKLREGNIENKLIYYEREEKAGPKRSDIILCNAEPTVKEILAKVLGVLIVVDKQREIYFIDNVRFHLDKVKGLGTFVEIEAVDSEGSIGRKKLLRQCEQYLKLFRIPESALLTNSYSDMLLDELRSNGPAHRLACGLACARSGREQQG